MYTFAPEETMIETKIIAGIILVVLISSSFLNAQEEKK